MTSRYQTFSFQGHHSLKQDNAQKLSKIMPTFLMYLQECQKKFDVPNRFLRSQLGMLTEDEEIKLGQFDLCTHIKMGLMTVTGDLVDTKIREIYKLQGQSDKHLDKILSQCRSHDRRTPEEKALFYVRCLQSFPLQHTKSTS
ncbi:unnamed protein product [Diabrotica balteata]|uniref:Uncharacterized protein n=1 Tax=Diabrotica balteata TaxID=107213 RepID=A0A9N9SXF2_DIABA|nr:unnamed protein product [Diabrotica balteata]